MRNAAPARRSGPRMTTEAARAARARRLLSRGLKALAESDPDLAGIEAEFGRPPTRIRPEGFQTLFKIIVQQQVSIASGEAIWARLVDGLDDDAAIARLTAVKGIGRWTAEFYLLSALQRPDVFPAADLALMVAAGEVKRLPARPDAKMLVAMAEAWRPWRAIAARLLWHYYRHARGRDAGL